MLFKSRLITLFAIVSFVSLLTPSSADEWPQWRGPNRDGVWAETGVIDGFSSPQINRKWTVPISSGYCGPTVADGRVYVTDRVIEPEKIERVHCFDWQTGDKIWSFSYDCEYKGFSYTAGPRASVLIEDDRAYSLGAAGHLFCFDAAEGEVLWSKDLDRDYKIRMPLWGIAASPVVEGDLLILQIGGENDACLIALDKLTGEQRWTALSDVASYAAPIVIDQCDRRILVCKTGDRVVGVEGDSGKEHWAYPVRWKSWPIGIATPVLERDMLLTTEAHRGTLLLRLSADSLTANELWHWGRQNSEDKTALHCLISTPYVDGDFIYGADSRGVLRCLRLDTGKQVWEDRTAVAEDRFATIHLIRNGDRTWLFNEKGELIIAKLTPQRFNEISRAKLLDTTQEQLPRRRGGVTWSHPAFAYRHVFARNDKELVCADLSAQ